MAYIAISQQAILKFNEYSSFTCESMKYDGNGCEKRREFYFLISVPEHIFSVTVVTHMRICFPHEMIASYHAMGSKLENF
jgi:hypothetical protein